MSRAVQKSEENHIIDEEKRWDLWFQGTESEVSDAVLKFLGSHPNCRQGVTFAQLENFFVLKSNICSKRALCNHLESLQKHKLVTFDMCRGLKFYKVKK